MDTHLLPKDRTKVRFTDSDNFEHTGIFLADENMFFIGYEDSGDFRFPFQIKHWENLDDSNNDFLDITKHIIISQYEAIKTYKSFEEKGYTKKQLKAVRDLFDAFNIDYK